MIQEMAYELVCGEHPPFPSCHASNEMVLVNGVVQCVCFAGSKEGANDIGI